MNLFCQNNDEELNRVWNIFLYSPIKGQFTQTIYLWFNRITRSLPASCHPGCRQTYIQWKHAFQGLCVDMCWCFAANAVLLVYLWGFLCPQLALVVSRMEELIHMGCLSHLKGQTAQTQATWDELNKHWMVIMCASAYVGEHSYWFMSMYRWACEYSADSALIKFVYS